MTEVDILDTEGKKTGATEIPHIFAESVRPELVLRAVNAENTYALQPQAHYPLAGMNTSARYYGSMNSYRTGRHMGIAIRPREKLASGVQGKVRRIPSAVTGKRAHPHVIEKILIERMNKREYRKAIASAIAATISPKTSKPIVVSDEIESIRKTKDMSRLISNLGLKDEISSVEARRRKGLGRSSRAKRYSKSLLIIVGKESGAIKSARNIAGVDACSINKLSANLLAPGGNPGRIAIWSAAAIAGLERAVSKLEVGRSS
jgi:large subunit ribosomal protein L4e